MRDGEQSPGASMTRDEKMRIARQLERMRVDVIEAGLPGRQRRRFRGGEGRRRHHQGQHVCGLARANEQRRPPLRRGGARKRSRRASTPSSRPRPSTWSRSCAWSPSQVIEQAVRAVKWARELHRQRRVLARGRRPLRRRFPLPHPRAGDQGRRHHHQHPGHGRLHAARAVRRADPQAARAHSQLRQGRSGRCTATTTSGWRWPTRCPRC